MSIIVIHFLVSLANHRHDDEMASGDHCAGIFPEHRWLTSGWEKLDSGVEYNALASLTDDWQPVTWSDVSGEMSSSETPAWFRTTFLISELEAGMHVLNLQVLGAAQVYLNGGLVHEVGHFDESGDVSHVVMEHVTPYFPPTFLESGLHSLEVRVANPSLAHSLHMLYPRERIVFRAEVLPLEQAVQNLQLLENGADFLLFLFGISLAIGFYHLVIWRGSRKRRSLDLYYAIFSLVFALRIHLIYLSTGTVESWIYPLVAFGGDVVECLLAGMLILLFQHILGVKSKWRYVMIASAWTVLTVLLHGAGIAAVPLFYVAVNIALLSLAALAARNKEYVSRTVTVSAIGYLLGTAGLILLEIVANVEYLVLETGAALLMLIPYTVIATYMGRHHASTLLQLEQEVHDNEILRKQAVEQEKRLHVREKFALELQNQVEHERLEATRMTAGGIAHELNTPLAIVNLSAEMILMKLRNLNPEEDPGLMNRDLENHSNRILEAVERISEQVSHLQQITKVETKKYVGDQRVLDLIKSSDSLIVDDGLSEEKKYSEPTTGEN
jgi:signal transduction histidine kinase